jgi:Flp pilus assembly secretin CpaC
MSIEARFLDLMPSTVTIFTQTAKDAYGKQTFPATGTAVRCRVVPEDRVMRTGEGKEVVASARIYCYGTPTVTTDSKVLLPDGSEATVLAVQVQNDQSGAHHTVITVGGL